ncbi:MAG: diacylglycerol/lipid kinase family protein [Bdellovibrionia bacterium]
MRVSVVINSKAGSVDPALIREKIGEALFRCDLSFCEPANLDEMCNYIHEQIEAKTDYLIVCGGDGTINACLQCLMSSGIEMNKMPPIAVVRSGTANDLASILGVSRKVDQAVRNILEGTVKYIDVIEVEGDGKKSYMLTNGGLGIPALAAELANQMRHSLRRVASCENTAGALKFVTQNSFKLLKKIGPNIYSLMVAEALRKWEQKGWSLEIEMPGKFTLETSSPVLLINNLPQIGSSFTPAPLTSNSDGTVNLLISEGDRAHELLHSAYHLRMGTINNLKRVKSFELRDFTLRSKTQRKLTFFGDGEILHKDVQEIKIKCLRQSLPVVVSN